MSRSRDGGRAWFWSLARRMLRYRGSLVLALVMAFVSAGGLGVGLVALPVALASILQRDAPGLAERAREWIAAASARASELGLPAPEVPRGLLDALPADRFGSVLVIVLALGVLTLLGAAANFLHAWLSLTVATTTIADIRRSAYHRLLRLPLATVSARSGSDLVSRITSDTNALSKGFTSLTNKAVAQVTKGAAALVAALVIDWRLTLATLVAAPVLFVIIRKLGKRIRRATRAAMRNQGALLGVATDAVRGFRVMKVHGAERAEVGRFTRINREVLRQQLRARTARALAGPVTEVVAIAALGALALVAAKAIIDGELEAAAFIGAIGSLAIAGQSLKPLNAVVQDIQHASAAADRVGELLGLDLEEDRRADRARPALARHRESIRFENVRFRYPGAGEEALAGVSIDVRAGETLAVVGGNGSGKTTLLSLVPRLFDPTEGRVLIDGVDLAGVSLRSLRNQVAVVTQEVVLFRGTVAENIAYGRPGATRAEVEEVARRAHADAFIRALPEGYDTTLADQGLSLSGGQRQRLSIARAVLRDPAILLMDEATSMIDAESEASITRALTEFGSARTVLVVAHRLGTIASADRIAVLERGRLAGVGTHEELMGSCGAYRSLRAGPAADAAPSRAS